MSRIRWTHVETFATYDRPCHCGCSGCPTGDAFARPVDILVVRDGSLLMSDDQGHRIYRVTYGR